MRHIFFLLVLLPQNNKTTHVKLAIFFAINLIVICKYVLRYTTESYIFGLEFNDPFKLSVVFYEPNYNETAATV